MFIEWNLNKISSLALLIIIWQTFDQAFETGAFTSVKPENMIFIVFISINYYVLWTTICVSLSTLWLGKEDTIAVAYCVPAKTPAMGVPLSNVLFPRTCYDYRIEGSDSDGCLPGLSDCGRKPDDDCFPEVDST